MYTGEGDGERGRHLQGGAAGDPAARDHAQQQR